MGVAVLARRQVRARLAAEGLAGRQAALRPSACPLRVVVVAPPGRGLEDFVAVLAASPWAWQVEVVSVPSEGVAAPTAIAAAIGSAGRAELIVVTRGGGAGVTAAYDAFEVAAAVCASAAPVVVAVGHSVDASVADEMAWRSLATPTAAGKMCVELVEHADRFLVEAARGIVTAGRACLDHNEEELDALEAALRARAATVARDVALARWRRTARVAVLTAAVLAAMVLCLLLMR